MTKVFFYGLFMDDTILIDNGINPIDKVKGYLNNYTLKIGNRASLIKSEGMKSYGIIIEASEKELNKLYAEQSVADYIPEAVEVITINNKLIKATCYNLPERLLIGTNKRYAESLYDLAKKLDFPKEYLKVIKSYVQ